MQDVLLANNPAASQAFPKKLGCGLRSALLIATVNNPATRNRITGRPKAMGRTAVVRIAARHE